MITYAAPDEPFQGPMMHLAASSLARHGLAVDRTEIRRYYGHRDATRMRAAAATLAEWRPDAILSMMTNADLAIHAATETLGTPIICWSMQPRDAGLVQHMSRPGGRIAAVAFPPVIPLLQLRILRTLVPDLATLGYLHNPGYAPAAGALARLKVEADRWNIGLSVCEPDPSDFIGEIAALRDSGAQALVVGPHEVFNLKGRDIGAAALDIGLPAIGTRNVAEGGGVASLMPDFARIWDAAAVLLTRVLAGESPASMPVDRHIMPLLILNSAAIDRLGLDAPEALREDADEIIERIETAPIRGSTQ